MKAITKISRVVFGIAASLVLVANVLGQSSDSPQSKQAVRHLDISTKPWTGDFDRMLERRMIRALVPYSRTLYFNDKGRERGITADNVRNFECWITNSLGLFFLVLLTSLILGKDLREGPTSSHRIMGAVRLSAYWNHVVPGLLSDCTLDTRSLQYSGTLHFWR